MTGLYFYKLVSPYEGDVTKDCKLTVNEIDHNFSTLKGNDIKSVSFDEENNRIVLTKNNGEILALDLSSMVDGMTTNLDVKYDSADGIISMTYNGEEVVIDGLITKENLSKEILTKVCADSTLVGLGTIGQPLKIAEVEKTGSYKAAYKLIDTIKGEKLPTANKLVKGDRYVTLEEFSDYGYLYNYTAVKRLNEDLANCGWRVPTKEDWDNMLNAIEPCEYRNHHSLINNNILGRVAGKLLKSADKWMSSTAEDVPCNICGSETCGGTCSGAEYDYTVDKNQAIGDEDFDVTIEEAPVKPQAKPLETNGVDSYGMGIVPAGNAYNCQPTHYNHFGVKGAYWTSTMMYETDVYSKVFNDTSAGVAQIGEQPSSFLSIRLVKDYDGGNHNAIENINGMNYETILMPSLNTPTKHTIWTATNLAFRDSKYPMVTPNNGMGVTSTKKYIINEWDGFNWKRKELVEGDSLVLINGIAGRPNEEYRVIDGVLVSITETIYQTIKEMVKEDVSQLQDQLDKEIERSTEQDAKHDTEIAELNEKNVATNEKLTSEIERSTTVDAEHATQIDEMRKILEGTNDKLSAEIERSEATDLEHSKQIADLYEKNIATNEKIVSEIQRSNEVDELHNQEIEKLKANLDKEAKARQESDDAINNKLINIDGTVHTYECEKGVLTLKTNDGTPITIKLDSNYGTF